MSDDQIYWAVTPHRKLKGKWEAEVGDKVETFDQEEDGWLWIYKMLTTTLSRHNAEYAEKW